MELQALNSSVVTILFGSTPVSDGIAAAREILEQHPDSRELQGRASRILGTLLALQGDDETGRELLEQARTIFTELGHKQALAGLPFSTGPLELRSGNPAAAEAELRAGLETMQTMGERARVSSMAALLAGALLDQGRFDEAGEYIEVARDALSQHDLTGEAAVKMSMARLQAHRGDLHEAVRLAAEAIALMDETDEAFNRPDLLMSQAEVLELAGRLEDAKAVLSKAADVAARKGALVDERRARERLAALTGSVE
jgi:tetratricopeptide (TPR) repeat protein